MFLPAVQDRALLWLNHVLAAEPAATQRMARHAGRKVSVQWQAPPGPWPVPPALVLLITPAGLAEKVEAEVPADAATGLHIVVALPAPHELLGLWLEGRRPQVSVEGDAQFAADVAWLTQNLRWDVEQDLARFIGGGPAHELMRYGGALGEALRNAARGIKDTWSRSRPSAASQ